MNWRGGEWMAIGRRAPVDALLRTLWTVGIVGDADDRTLLSRYALSRDDRAEEAFRVLVERHGPMVLRICRQVVGDRQDAEDATQAVFLVLARKAGSIRVEGTVVPWLHGVARRVAAKAKGRAAARRRAESRAVTVAASLHDGEKAPGVESWETVHQEVDRLPEKYRAPVVLCYLQGQTYEQAARQIGCPIGTVRVRLSRAREQLRARLGRRGFAPERIAAVGWFTQDLGGGLPTCAASVAEWALARTHRVDAIIQAIRALSTGRSALAGTVPALVLELYEGGMRTMLMSQWMTAAAVGLLTATGAIGFTAVGLGGQDKATTSKSQPPASNATQRQPVDKPPVDFDSPETLSTQADRWVAAAQQRLDAQRAYYEQGRITIDRYIDASEQLMRAEIAVSATKDRRVAAAKANMDRIAEIVKVEQAQLEKGRGTSSDVAEALVAQERAAFIYLEARQERGSYEVEILKKRVEALEKQLKALGK
jgi:RNA polymerase sigma factor (sigma-70 family)